MNWTWLYVATVYGGSALLARRARVDLPWRVVALFYVLVLAFFFRPMTGPYVNVGPDVLNLVMPWSASAPPGFDKFDVANYELQDVVFQFVPWTQQVHEQWRAWRVPLWNDYAACGMPLMANMQSGALSPLRLLTIPLPLAHAFSAEAAFKVLVALTFTFLYCRRRGYDLLPSLVGAISFGFGTFMLIWLHFPHPNVAMLLPAVLHQIDLLAEKATRGRILFAIMLGPALLAGGHPETTAHIVFVAALYCAWLMFVERKKLLKTLLAVSIASLLVAAPVLMPLLETLPLSMSYERVREHSHAESTTFSDFKSLALLVNPRLYGERPAPVWGPTVPEAVTGFVGILGIGAWFGLLARAIVRRRFGDRETFFLIATAVLFLWIADVPVVSAPMRALFSMALNGRFRLQFSFFLAVQVAALLHFVKRDGVLPMIPTALAAAIGALALVFGRTNFPSDEARMFALSATIPSAVVLTIAALLCWPRARTLFVPLLAVAVFVELWEASHSWHPVTRGLEIYRRTPLIEELWKRRGPEPYRMVAIGGALFPNTHAPFRFEDVRVKDAMASANYMRLLRATRNWDAQAYYEKWADPDSPLLDELNVKWVITDRGVDLADRARYRMVYDGPDGRVYENARARPRFYGQEAYIAITNRGHGAYELHVDARRPTLIKSSVGYWPGWRVTRDGQRVRAQRVNEAFLGFEVPAGNSVVQLRYAPLSFWGGAAIAGLTLLALTVWTIRTRSVSNETTAEA